MAVGIISREQGGGYIEWGWGRGVLTLMGVGGGYVEDGWDGGGMGGGQLSGVLG